MYLELVPNLNKNLYMLKSIRHHTKTRAIMEQYKELLRDIYRLECDTARERIIRKVVKKMPLLKQAVVDKGDYQSKYAIHYLESYIKTP